MILFEILNGDERHPAYQSLEVSNGKRQYDFLHSIVTASIDLRQRFLSSTVIRALNFHSIACLHISSGEYRPCGVTVGPYLPPDHYRVPALMEEFVNQVNREWENADPIVLAAYVLWKINSIHPFINGNGRTARATSYFVLCAKVGRLLPGNVILPELLRQNRDEYVAALKVVDSSIVSGDLNLSVLHALISRLLEEQLASAGINIPVADELAM
jgi:hypothetical protein